MKPTIYLDTNICRDCIRNRTKISKESIHLMGIIKDREWNCTTSVFTLMELYDLEKDDLFFNKKLRHGLDVNSIIRQRQHKDLNKSDLQEVEEKIQSFYEEYKFINFHALEGTEGWTLANTVSRQTNLSAPDCIHLAVALGSNSHIIVTSDQEMISEGTKFLKENNYWNQIRISKPNDVKDTLEKLVEDMQQDPDGYPPFYEYYSELDIDEKILDKLSEAQIEGISDLLSRSEKELVEIVGLEKKEIKPLLKKAVEHYNKYKIILE